MLNLKCILIFLPKINKCILIYVCFTQFDYLKSLEIEEKINKINWCQQANGALFLLSTNDKTIKFWKVSKELFDISCYVITCAT